MIVEVYLDGSRLDLFEEDSINIVQNVQDVNDISKISADFSKTFSVPASANNNRVFKQWYNPDIDNGFDSRVNVDAFILLDGVPFKFGKIRLENVKTEYNQPKTYSITFFGDAIKLKELIDDDELVDLEWLSNFDHDYDGAQVLDGLQNGLDFTVDSVDYNQAIIYPLISYTKQYKYNSDVSDTTNTDTLVNISYDASRTQGINYSDLKPAIKCDVILKAIQEKYELDFLGNFFNTSDFNQLYMNLNNNDTSLNAGFIEIENIQDQSFNVPESISYRLDYTTTVVPKSGFEDVPRRAKKTINGETVYQDLSDVVGTRIYSGGVFYNNRDLPNVFSVTSSLTTNEDFEFDAYTNLKVILYFPSGIITIIDNTYLNQLIDLRIILNNILPDIKVFDWLTSMFSIFNLTVESINKELYFNDLPTWYAEGNIIDITKYVDNKELTIKASKRYNEFNFKFQESEQIIADEFNRNNKRYYGDLEQKIFTDETKTKQIEGESYDIEVDFENPVFERIKDENTNELVNIQYCPYINRELNTISGEPFLFYANQVSVVSNPIGFNTESAYSEITGSVIMPTHTQELDNTESFSFLFAADINEFTYQAMINNSFSTYYSDYIGDLFSIKRRNYILDAILPINVVQELRLNDRFIIGDDRFIINSIDSNLVNRSDSLELINDIYSAPLASDTLNNGVFLPASKTFNNTATISDTQYIGLANQTPILVDNGFGTSWVTIDSFGSGSVSTVNFSLTENETGSQRTAVIRVTNAEHTANFLIIQNTNGVSFDSETITFDNDTITFDRQ